MNIRAAMELLACAAFAAGREYERTKKKSFETWFRELSSKSKEQSSEDKNTKRTRD